MKTGPALDILPLTVERAELGESPVWSESDQAIWWVDITGRLLYRTEAAGRTATWHTPELIGFVQPSSGKLFVGMESGLFQFDPKTAGFTLVAPIPKDGQRFNDACIDDRGRIWAGTMDIDNRRAVGVLYLFDPVTGTLTPQLDGLLTVNGLAWDAAREILYVSDSHPTVQTVWRFRDVRDGAFSKRETFARFDDLKGRPDGAALDAAGRYWIAGVGGGELYRFEVDGRCTAFALPLTDPTKPAFVGEDRDRMVVTSKVDAGFGGRLCLVNLPTI